MRRLGLIAVLLLGLVVTTPVICVCGPNDHGGQALHSLLPHAHDGHGAHADHPGGASDHHGIDDDRPDDAADPAARTPSVSAQAGAGAGALTATGAVGPATLTAWRLVPALLGRTPPAAVQLPAPATWPPSPPPPRSPAR